MNNKDFEILKKYLKGHVTNYIDTDGDIIFVTTDEGLYKIIKDNGNDMYLVEYMPKFGHKELSLHFTMSGVIEYIKEGDKYRE